jgi:hypothetical protein
MKYENSHLSDQQLLLNVEGELSERDERLVREHLAECWRCRARHQELESAITVFMRAHRRAFDAKLPPAAGPHALLKARIAELSATQPNWRSHWFPLLPGLVRVAALCGALALGLVLVHSNIERRNSSRARAGIFSIPDSRLTPGAALLVSRPAVCSQPDIENKAVPAAVQRKVFEEYGIAHADPRAYEVDYLITPALGGADDIHNLWPHSYSATVWNAHVKDALEDRLREMVCAGSLDLTQAQQEIAANWIDAYKKYFHTDKPLSDH